MSSFSRNFGLSFPLFYYVNPMSFMDDPHDDVTKFKWSKHRRNFRYWSVGSNKVFASVCTLSNPFLIRIAFILMKVTQSDIMFLYPKILSYKEFTKKKIFQTIPNIFIVMRTFTQIPIFTEICFDAISSLVDDIFHFVTVFIILELLNWFY